MNDIRVKWNQIYTQCITLSTGTKTNTLMFTDAQVIIADWEDNLHREVFILQTAKYLGMEISPEGSETRAFLGQDLVRCKIVVDNKCLKVLCFLLYNSPAAEFYVTTFRNTLFHIHRPMKMEQTERSETSPYKIQTLENCPEENIQNSEQGESLKSRNVKTKYRILKYLGCKISYENVKDFNPLNA